MLDEYQKAVPHDSFLSAEERRRMSERNRGAASHTVYESAEPAPPPRSDRPKRSRRKQTSAKRMRRRDAAPDDAVRRAEEEQAAMLERMQQSERNRQAARSIYAPEEDPEPDTPDAVSFEEYEDEYDTGTSHAATVARSSLRSLPDFRHGWFLAFPFISGSSALLPEEMQSEADQPEAPETERTYLPEARADADLSESGRKKVSGGRYSDYSRFGGYQRRITTGGPIIIGLLTVLLIGCVIYGKVQTNEVYTKIAELQAEYDDITARNVSMKSEMEGKLTVKNIEEYAKNVLGLRPLDQSQIEYIQIQTEDEVTITKPEQNLIVTINDFLTSVWEFLRGA